MGFFIKIPVGGGVQRAPKCWQPRHCAGSRPTRKYDIGLGLFGDGVATRIKPGIHLLQQLDPMVVPNSRLQRTGSEAGYGRLNIHPILQSASICICDLLSLNYPIIPLLPCNLGLPSINWSFLD